MGCAASAPEGRTDGVSKGGLSMPAAATGPDSTGLPPQSGNLAKLSAGLVSQWQQRFFKLNNWFLVYWPSEESVGPPMAMVDLSAIEDVQLDTSDTTRFSILFSDGSRYHFKAQDTEVAVGWVHALLGRGRWAREHSDVVHAAQAVHSTSSLTMAVSSSTGLASLGTTSAPYGGGGAQPAAAFSFSGLDVAARRQREEQRKVRDRLSAEAERSGAGSQRRASLLTRPAAGAAAAAAAAAPAALGAIAEDDSSSDGSDSGSESPGGHGRGGGAARRRRGSSGAASDSDSEASVQEARPPLSLEEAMRHTTAEMDGEPMLEGKIEKRQKPDGRWQARYIRVMGGSLAYFASKDLAEISADRPLGRPRGVIPLRIVEEVAGLGDGKRGGSRSFAVTVRSRPRDEAFALAMEAACARDATDRPNNRRPKEPWGRSFLFRSRKEAHCEGWILTLQRAMAWWARCDELVLGTGRPPMTAGSAGAGAGGAAGAGAAGAAAAAASAKAEASKPKWLETAIRHADETAVVRQRIRDRSLASRGADGAVCPENAARNEADTALLAGLDLEALTSSYEVAQEAANAAKKEAEASAEDGAGADVGEELALRQLGPVINAITESLIDVVQKCQDYSCERAAKVMIRAFDMALTAELRPFQTGTGAAGTLSAQRFDVILDRIAALERFVQVRSHAITTLDVSFQPGETTKAQLLQEQRHDFVKGAVELVRASCHEVCVRLIARLQAWDNSSALPTRPGQPVCTIAPREIATMFNGYLDQAAGSHCSLLVHLLLGVVWVEVSGYSHGVLELVEKKWNDDPGALLQDDCVALCRVINDCLEFAKFIEAKGAAARQVLDQERSLLDRRLLEVAEKSGLMSEGSSSPKAGAGGGGGHGDGGDGSGDDDDDDDDDADNAKDGLTAQLEEEREELEGLVTDRVRILQALMQTGYFMLNTLRDIIMMELTTGLPQPKGPDGAPLPKDRPGAAGDDPDDKPPLKLLFRAEWDAPGSEKQRPINCACGIIVDWMRDLRGLLARVWLRRLTAILFEKVIAHYLTELARQTNRQPNFLGIGGWRLTDERRSAVARDVADMCKAFGTLEQVFAVTSTEAAAAKRAEELASDPVTARVRSAATNADTSLDPLRELLTLVTNLVVVPASAVEAAGTSLVEQYPANSVEIRHFLARVLPLRDDMHKPEQAAALKAIDATVVRVGRIDVDPSALAFDVLRYNANMAAFRIIDGVLPPSKATRDAFWRHHRQSSGSTVPLMDRLRFRAAPRVVTAAEAKEARSAFEGATVDFSDFLASGEQEAADEPAAAAAAASAAPAPRAPPPPLGMRGAAPGSASRGMDGESVQSPGSVASRRRRSVRPQPLAAFRVRAGDSSLGGIEAEPFSVPGASDPSPHSRHHSGGLRADQEDAVTSSAKLPMASGPLHAPPPSPPRHSARAPARAGNPFEDAAPAPPPMAAKSGHGGIDGKAIEAKEESECASQ
ncbi:hypothetical protein FNF27_01338 [Cafeteria roenbergensis]|uniref:PH domain-containing protein n=3 Tax=Cafeteria roenbergensis TaxID=33653 RepID=A0A5A8DG40_CAFRO|nr:hypothetical protein FNF31_02558 [Cafeteria roenbergensis]KAA0177008.1 hypothetical protein FNF27_01338 [Cafeteria roenbergensis]